MDRRKRQGQHVGVSTRFSRHGSRYGPRRGEILRKPRMPYFKTHDKKTYPLKVKDGNIAMDIYT